VTEVMGKSRVEVGIEKVERGIEQRQRGKWPLDAGQ